MQSPLPPHRAVSYFRPRRHRPFPAGRFWDTAVSQKMPRKNFGAPLGEPPWPALVSVPNATIAPAWPCSAARRKCAKACFGLSVTPPFPYKCNKAAKYKLSGRPSFASCSMRAPCASSTSCDRVKPTSLPMASMRPAFAVVVVARSRARSMVDALSCAVPRRHCPPVSSTANWGSPIEFVRPCGVRIQTKRTHRLTYGTYVSAARRQASDAWFRSRLVPPLSSFSLLALRPGIYVAQTCGGELAHVGILEIT